MAPIDLLTPLDRIVARHGATVLADRARLTGLLRDHAPDELPAIRAFIGGLDLGVPERVGPPGGAQDATTIGRESEALAASAGCAPELARQAVETWARILARCNSAPLPLPTGAVGAVQQLPGTIQPLPGAQAPPLVQPLPGVAGLPGAQPASAGMAPTSRSGARMVVVGLILLAIVVAAVWILRILAS